ncbi:MAG: SHOCT domain-containing protein, partial [Rudaea sp.]
TESSLEKVNDVKMSQSVLGRMLDYGDLEILTASELAPNVFRRIASPIKFKTAMLNQKEAMGNVDEMPQQPGIPPARPDVPALLANLDALRKQGIITEDEFERKKQELLARI